jgi:hypothetical protein
VMGNEELLRYFISERQDWDDLSDQAGKVLKTATVDVANHENYQYAMNAADISSHALYILGDKDAAPLDGVKEEVGQIVGTYIMSAQGVMNNAGQEHAGINLAYINGDWPEPFTEADGFPRYGINLNKSVLTNVLNDIGDNDEAARTVGQATTMYNQAWLDKAATMPRTETDEQFTNTVAQASLFSGYMQDGLLDGKILGADAEVEARKKAAELFTLPLDFIKTDKVPVIGDYIMGEIKDGITEAYAGDNSEAVVAANTEWNNTLTTTKLQSFYAMAESGNYNDIEVVQNWPTENGEPVSPDKLTRDQINAILGPVRGYDGDETGRDVGYNVVKEADQSFDNATNQFG